MLGALKAGAAYAPLDGDCPDERLQLLLDRCAARALVVDAPAARRLAGRPEAKLHVGALSSGDGLDLPAPPASTGPDDIAYVIFTSGSTGIPKGVEITHRGLANLVHWHLREFGVVAGDRASQVAGPAFDAFGWEVWPYLCAGASVHFVDDVTRAAPDDLLDWFAREHITIGFVPTPVAEPMLGERMPQALALRALLTGGDRLHRPPPQGLPFAVYNNYGPTECSVVATSMRLIPAGEAAAVPPPIGHAIANARLYVLDAARHPVPVGVWGELCIGGAGLARGYRGDAAQTAERFIEWRGTRLYSSGDVVRWRTDGTLEFRGRSDRQVKVRGHRVELGEVESALLRDERLREAAVVLRDDGDLVAYLVAQPAHAGDPSLAKGVREAVGQRLPEHQVPSAVVLLERLPLTANGKVDLRVLPAPAAASGGDEPQGPVETALVQLMRDVLGRERIGRHDHFFADLGGHSLLATQLVSRVRSAFDIELPLRTFFGTPTVAALGEAVEDALIVQIEALSNEDAARLAAQA